MQVVKGAPNHGSFSDGTETDALIAQKDNAVHLPPALQCELEPALAEADQAPGISSGKLFAELFGKLEWDASFDYKAGRTRRK